MYIKSNFNFLFFQMFIRIFLNTKNILNFFYLEEKKKNDEKYYTFFICIYIIFFFLTNILNILKR